MLVYYSFFLLLFTIAYNFLYCIKYIIVNIIKFTSDFIIFFYYIYVLL